MSRNRLMKSLITATACGGLVWGQAVGQTPPLESRLGKVITVQESDRPAEKCTIVRVWRSAEGNPVMQAKCLQSGDMITILEQPKETGANRFRVFHWVKGEPPHGCPLPPEMAAKAPLKSAEPEKPDAKQPAGALKNWPAAHSAKTEVETKPESTKSTDQVAMAKETEKKPVPSEEAPKPPPMTAEKPVEKSPEPEKVAAKPQDRVVAAADTKPHHADKTSVKLTPQEEAPKHSPTAAEKPVEKPAAPEKVVVKAQDRNVVSAADAKPQQADKKQPKTAPQVETPKHAPTAAEKPAEKPAATEKVVKSQERVVATAADIKPQQGDKTHVDPVPQAESPKRAGVFALLRSEKPAEKPAAPEKVVAKAPEPIVAKAADTRPQSGDKSPVKTVPQANKPAADSNPFAMSKEPEKPRPDHLASSPYGTPAAGTAGHVSLSPYVKEPGASATLPPRSAPSASASATPGSAPAIRPPHIENAYATPAAPAKSAAPAMNEAPSKKITTPDTAPRPAPELPVVKEAKADSAPAVRDVKHAAKPVAEPTADEITVTLTRPDGSPMKCVVLSEGVRADGSKVSQVRVVETGEIMTMVEPGQPSHSSAGVSAEVSAAKPSLAQRVKDRLHSSDRASVMPHEAVVVPQQVEESRSADKGTFVRRESSMSMPATSPEMMPAKPGLVQRVKDRLSSGDRVVSEMPHETVVPSRTMEESKPADKSAHVKAEVAMPMTAPVAPEMTPPKPGLVQRVRDRLHGSDRVVGEMPHETVVASKKIDESKSAGTAPSFKKEEVKSVDVVVSAKPEPPKPAESVDWHKSWGSEARPKSVEVGKKAEPLPPLAESKPIEKPELSTKVVAPPAADKVVASARVEQSPAIVLPPVEAPMMKPPAVEPPKVAMNPPVMSEPKPVAPESKPNLPDPKLEAPKVAMVPPMSVEPKMQAPLPEPRQPEPTVMEMKPPVAGVIRPAGPVAPTQESPGMATASSRMESKPGIAKPAEFNEAGLSTSPQVGFAEASAAKPKTPPVDPEVRRAQAIQYSAVLMELLQNSGSPSEREMAAIQLRMADSSTHAIVSQALLQAAKHDAAPLVRIAAIKSLMEMKVHTPDVKAMLEEAAGDRDPRVRDEAKLALSLMNKPPEVRPASYRR